MVEHFLEHLNHYSRKQILEIPEMRNPMRKKIFTPNPSVSIQIVFMFRLVLKSIAC